VGLTTRDATRTLEADTLGRNSYKFLNRGTQLVLPREKYSSVFIAFPGEAHFNDYDFTIKAIFACLYGSHFQLSDFEKKKSENIKYNL
jgi:hypothetical protein